MSLTKILGAIASLAFLFATPASPQAVPRSSLTTTNAQIFINCPVGTIQCIHPTAVQSLIASIIASYGSLADTNVWTGANIFTANPQLSGCVGYPKSTGAAPVGCAPTIPGADLAAGAAQTNINSNLSNSIGALTITQSAMAPINTGSNGSVGLGALYTPGVRTGGFGEYGHILSLLTVSPSVAVPVGQFDVASTGWVTNTNDNGGQMFGGWFGANTPAANLGENFASGQAIGAEINYGNRWGDLGLYTNLGGVRQTIGLQIVPDVLPATDGVNTFSITMTCAAPSVFTWANNGLSNNYAVALGGTPCTGFTAGTTYYVVNVTTNTFQLSATLGGAAINGTGSSSAVTGLASWPGTFGVVISPSAHGHETWVGNLLVPDAIVAGGHAYYQRGGSIAANAPLDWLNLQGYWNNGLDLSGASFSTFNAITLSASQNIAGGGFIGTAITPSTSPGTGALRTAGGLGVALNAFVGGTISTGGYTIAGLPTCNAGAAGTFAYVTNGVATPTYYGAVSTTGASTNPVFCAGAGGWVYH